MSDGVEPLVVYQISASGTSGIWIETIVGEFAPLGGVNLGNGNLGDKI